MVKVLMVLCISFSVVLLRIVLGYLESEDLVYALLPVRLGCNATTEAQAGTIVEPTILLLAWFAANASLRWHSAYGQNRWWKSNSCLLPFNSFL